MNTEIASIFYDEEQKLRNPFDIFKSWLTFAEKESGLKDYNAMVLSTADKEGAPSSRVVLLKGFDERGFVFFTNRTSRKGKELHDNPQAALNFYWDKFGRQIRIEGKIEQVDDKESDDYFATRRRGSQIGAWASHQSAVMKQESDFLERIKLVGEQFSEGVIPRPPFWGGFRLIPHHIEFWLEGEFRLHIRIVFTKNENGAWDLQRLYP